VPRVRYALLLRGVNVGPKNSLPMADLRGMLEDVGCTDVKTYVQSGNAVFETKLAEAKLTKAIEAALASYMGRPIATTLRTMKELEAIVANNPLPEHEDEPSRLCVTFLSHVPTKAELAPLAGKDFTPERFVARGREIYTWHPDGQGRSPLRGAVTTRNWNTVQKLLAMLA